MFFYKTHLSQLLWNVECSALDPFIAGVVPHLQVLVNQVDLDQLGTLDGHVKRHRDDNLDRNKRAFQNRQYKVIFCEECVCLLEG